MNVIRRWTMMDVNRKNQYMKVNMNVKSELIYV